MVFHVLNRGAGRARLFDSDEDYAAFERIIEETLGVRPMRLLAYCLMPNHWHMVLHPEADGDLSAFMQRLSVTHATRWQRLRRRPATGHVYQGRFKSFPVEIGEPFYQVVRYVERNPLRADLVEGLDQWCRSSFWRHCHGTPQAGKILAPWPLERPAQWKVLVERPQAEAELAAVRRCVERGNPFGSPAWSERVVEQLGLQSTLRSRGRPRKYPSTITRALPEQPEFSKPAR
jgi:putative transposase